MTATKNGLNHKEEYLATPGDYRLAIESVTMIAMQLVGTEQSSQTINCIMHVGPIFAGFALLMFWLRHYLAKTWGGVIAARVIGVLLAVPVGNWAGRTFISYYPNCGENARVASTLLILFILLCVFICLNLITLVGPPPANPPARVPGQFLPPGGYYDNP